MATTSLRNKRLHLRVAPALNAFACDFTVRNLSSTGVPAVKLDVGF